MKPTAATVSIASLISGGMLAVDVSVYDGKNFDPVSETIASEQVEVRQVDTVIEAKAPWKGEEGLTVQYDLGQPTFAENLRDRRKEEVIYERVDFGDGGFKIDVLLTEKPDTNRFCYAIEGYENYDFFYQPPLTAEEIAEGASRPPEIEGSYAVYHKTLKNHEIGKENYATGKVMHIPRPQVWEIGNEEATKQWADLSYTDGQLCVTAPQDFLDNADYTNGIRIDPTFGYTTLGASTDGQVCNNDPESDMNGQAYTLSVDGTLTSIHAAVLAIGASSVADAFTAIYRKDSAGVGSHALVASKENLNETLPASSAFITFTGASESLVADDYILAITCDGEDIDGGTFSVQMVGDTGGASTDKYTEASLGVGGYATRKSENPWTATAAADTFQKSIYVTYVEGVSTPPVNGTKMNNGTIRINNGTLNI